jgi:hypothetical protein
MTLTGPQTTYSTATAPLMGTINWYNASGGAFSSTLPALSGLNVGANCIAGKTPLDLTYNAATFVANGADTFIDGTTSFFVSSPGENRTLQVVAVGGTKFWQITDGWSSPRLGGLTALTSEFSLSNSTTNTNILSTAVQPGSLAAGSVFRVALFGSLTTIATSGTLTLTPYLQGTALNTLVMASQTSAISSATEFRLDLNMAVRTTGSSGTAIAHGLGMIMTATPVYLTSTNTATTTVNTTTAASSNLVQVAAQWATANASNALKIETGYIERVL